MIYFPKVFRNRALLLSAIRAFDKLADLKELEHSESIARVIEQDKIVLTIIDKAKLVSPIGVSRHQIKTCQTIIDKLYLEHTPINTLCDQLALSRTSFFRYKKIAEKSIDANLTALLKKEIGLSPIDKASNIKSTFLSQKWYDKDGLASSGSIYSTFKAFDRRHKNYLKTALNEYLPMIPVKKKRQMFEMLSDFFFSCTSYNAFLAMVRARNAQAVSSAIGDTMLGKFLETIGILIFGIDFSIYDSKITTETLNSLQKSA